ncbi:aminotransferase class I/II-fold pyridoxal phosphate-dependent enzyme [Synechococcus sp. Cruz-9H2]|uniref:aminotransferase class I/II-fold pyridoxal phosphate-dependent enzyme n=1 Tax=unclassified Synechococcus TaxID=2626047 RepID=UPI0020CE2F11|nr:MULTISPECIES: aminotransferase class I/II-fold pyridoxal phosphate-dependent enzyme [unclassified Synechococcus]MCP9819078.1 aminotransferase class I/II-fold pyridoxal phosphate-dependent enzyme [Synechococcus sp. Cruz-9H2]MCP9843582.1 aminotransferase class I/II-fold pyridoxal phosphate-dependent enzyme [Synechococcus sp. Edmonson 11F2]MCP9855699.1 aminotransferase class I/II-fold pyridoxal phosphate-dependent enzyme [Synechococcus sp. Cruz-9C9]MCP9863137.1 aminotransferase class I/II-fold 
MARDPLDSIQQALSRVPAERQRRLRTFRPGPDATLLPGEAGPSQGPLLDLASNDYLGLSAHPSLKAAAMAAIQSDGVGCGGSRLVSGTRPCHNNLETALAEWLGRERVLLFPSGFQANLAAVLALADRHSEVIADRLIHHSLLVGIQASGAQLRRFRHNDLSDLRHLLERGAQNEPGRRRLVVSESLFSMEGTSPDLAGIAAACQEFGALLLVDEAHALGLLGPGGRGLAWGLAGVSLISGTFGKAFGAGGAFLASDGVVGQWLLQGSGAFRYTTALAPPLAAAALAALERLQADADQGIALLRRAQRWRDGLEAAHWRRPPGEGPVLPLHVGDDALALDLQRHLEQAGLLTVAIRPPTVPAGTARLRLVLRRDLPHGSLDRLLHALAAWPHAPVP